MPPPPQTRTPPAQPLIAPLALSWPAALIGLVFGVLMTYVPYEFRVASFRPLYPYVREMGITYLASSLAMMGALLYPHAPRWLDVLGRAGFILTTTAYWWVLNVLNGSYTGILLYPLLFIGLGLEAMPSFRRRPLFRFFAALIGVGFGPPMIFSPERFPSAIYAHLSPLMEMTGVLFTVAGLALLLPLGRWRPGLPRAVLGVLAGPYALLSWGLGRGQFWMGMSVYVILTLGCVAEAVAWRPRAPRTVGWKLLRGLAFAGLVPLLALGGVASFLAQRAIEEQVREDTVRTALGEADFVRRYLEDAHSSLQLLLDSPGFRQAFADGDPRRLEPYLLNIATRQRAFGAVLAMGAEGTVLASSTSVEGLGPLPPLSEAASEPFIIQGSRPQLAMALPFDEGGHRRGVLVGLLSLEQFSSASTPAARRFRVRVLDQRGLLLIRDTAPSAPLLSPAYLPEALHEAVQRSGQAVVETFDAVDRRILGTEAAVPGTHWSVVVTQELGVAYAAITRVSAAVVGMLMFGVLLALALSQFVARDVIRRLTALREATAALAAGELERRVEVEEDDELGELARGFNDMAIRTGATQAELREAVKAREEFLSVASHELRTPLTPLKGFASLTLQRLEQDDGHPEQAWLLKAMRSMSRQTDRLARLVDDLLDTARIQSGRFDLSCKPVDLLPVVSEVLERFELRGAEGLRFQLEPPSGPLEGTWDAARLDQVITNLLSNAVRYSPQGGTVRISFSESPSHVELQVRDEGIGIPPESLERLFHPFSRATNATSRHFGGLGLGLFICREIIERHGGTIWAESPGAQRGSCFHVRLPRVPPPAVLPPGPTPPSAGLSTHAA
ncbi:MAG: ATP-binding protein [Hyalangium sp.]|uniref:sensor histidine kinase n=1 Tax=Hyalangium sp. TaxID=2028555 RepID=UPI00389AE8EC